MNILTPWLFFLTLPFLVILLSRRKECPRNILLYRIIIVLCFGIAMTQPSLILGQAGFDIIVVVDRSQSMPDNTDERAKEIISLLEKDMDKNDTLTVLSVTETVIIEKERGNSAPFQGFSLVQQDQGSRLDVGLATALQLIPQYRSARILLISDGQNTGQSLETVRQQARSRSIPIFIRQLQKKQVHDISIGQLNYPKQVANGEPIQISADISSPSPQTVSISLRRNGEIIASGTKQLQTGHNQIQLLDHSTTAGINQYNLEVETPTDQNTGNNTAQFGTLITGKKKVLILTQTGTHSSLASILESQNIVVDVVTTKKINIDLPFLTRYQAIIFQDVPSTDFTQQELENIAYYVTELGGGLLMTGGPLSFGMGGYLRSPLEELLPVNLEIRQEHRKIGLALGIALDRSGSMSVSVGPNLRKIDLANQGSATAISLLSPMDSTVVYAVDTEAHPVIPLQQVNNPKTLGQRVLGIKSEGGGIYVDEALQALHKDLQKASQKNRHVALFADANDAVDNGHSLDIIKEMRTDNITVSVIALGTPKDYDANFLANVAKDGGGDIYFTTNPTELPKLFAMDTMLAAKSSFSEQRTSIHSIVGLTTLGGSRFSNFPTIDGYNIAYFKPAAQVGLQTKNTEPIDPIFAHQRVGLGQTAAYLGQIDGSFGSSLRKWNGYSAFFTEIVQAISLSNSPTLPFSGVQSEGISQIYTVESKEKLPLASVLTPNGQQIALDFMEIDKDIYQAKVEENIPGIHVVHVKTAEGAILLPPLSIPYSSEFQPRMHSHDQKELQRLSSLTGGKNNAAIASILEGSRKSKKRQSLVPYFILLGFALLLFEIADRRLRIVNPNFFHNIWNVRNQINQRTASKSKVNQYRRAQQKSFLPLQKKETSTSVTPNVTSAKKEEAKNDMKEALKRMRKK